MVKPLLIALCLLIAGAAKAADPAVTYDIRSELKDGALAALAVEMRFAGDASGRTTLLLPDNIDHGDNARPDLADVEVSGAAVETADKDTEVLRAAAGAPILVSYRIVSAYDGVPALQAFHALLLPTWFAVHGDRILLGLKGRDDAPASVSVSGLPTGWISASDFGGAGAKALHDVIDGYLIGGAGWQQIDAPMGAATLRFFYRTDFPPAAPEAGAALLARIAMGNFDFWRDPPSNLFVPIIPTTSDSGGRGIVGGFIMQATAGFDLSADTHDFAHEHTHSWISRQIGGFPTSQADLEAWLNEGFTELTAARSLLKARLWTLQDYASDLNAALLEYGVSPVKTAPNSLIQAERFSDWDVGRLPYYRGRMLGLMWEAKLRQATGGRLGLQDVLQVQRGLARRAEASERPTSADRLLPEAMRSAAGVDIRGDMARYVDRGTAISLPASLFGSCGALETVTQPAFDRGFDLMSTIRAGGRLQALEAGGPAQRVGLYEGERIHIDEVPSHDSQTTLTYRVDQPDGTQKVVTYKPEGPGAVTFQRFHLNPSLDAAGEVHCRAVLAGDVAP